jgi:hypothetical protein
LFDPYIILLIQYKTVEYYTPPEHKNLTISASYSAVGNLDVLLPLKLK